MLWVWLALAGHAPARTMPDAGDPVGFFTSVADKLLRSTFSFGVTNIPVCSNGVYVYTPAVQRLLQFSANIYDAANTNFFPAVFRPCFSGDTNGNLFITGYTNVASVTGLGDPRLAPPLDVAAALPAGGTNVFVNLYGVPWIIGAKKGLPNFNQFSLVNAVQVTRKLEVTRTTPNPATATYVTNQMYVMGISNSLGISFWNSYNSNYPNPLTIYASDTILMTLTNGINAWSGWTNFSFASTVTQWPGSQWIGSPPNATPNPNSFFNVYWSFNFLNPSVYRFNTASFDPGGSATSSGFETTVPPLPQLPPFGLNTTNYLQAFILDGSNVIDYVQLRGPVVSGNLNQTLADPDYLDVTAIRYQWSTNLYGSDPASPTWGVMNQLLVSGNSSFAPSGGQWVRPAGMPVAMGSTPMADAAFFFGFYLPTLYYNGQVYINTNLSIQAPYMPTRTVFSAFLLQANDPLVHYLASDLDSQNGGFAIWANKTHWQNGVWYKIGDPQSQPLPTPPVTPIGGRYQPWLRKGQMDALPNIISVTNNYACKDPLIEFSDNWSFPTNLLSSLAGLGQVHRGTPWQTFYLKDADLTKAYLNYGAGNNYVGTNTWMQWTGDFDVNDAALMAPVNDWRLAGLLMSLLNTNDPTRLFPVNDPNLADWQNVLNGLTVYSNSLPIVFPTSPPQFDTYVLVSNSPPALVIANAIAQARASQPNPLFYFIGDILATPALSRNSPFLNLGSTTFGQQQMNYGISDTAYEAIPAQLLPRLRPDSIGTMSATDGGWKVLFSGADGYAYRLQTSTNLADWNIVGTNFPVQGSFTVHVAVTNSPNQFYRSVLLP